MDPKDIKIDKKQDRTSFEGAFLRVSKTKQQRSVGKNQQKVRNSNGLTKPFSGWK